MSGQTELGTFERRKVSRHKSFLRGMIYFYNRRSVVDCLIRDISPYGARLAERGWRRPRLCLAHAGPGGLGSNYVGLPSMVGRGKDERGESRGIRRANSPPSVPGSTVPRPKIGRGRAPKGDAFSAERAPAEIRRPRKGEGGRGGDHGCAFRRSAPSVSGGRLQGDMGDGAIRRQSPPETRAHA